MVDPVMQEIVERQNEILQALVTNPSATLEAYKMEVGRWRGLQEALDIFMGNKKEDI